MLENATGLVYKKQMAVLYRELICNDAGVLIQDELRIYDSKWHSNHCQRISFNSDASCRRLMFAPDGSKLPPSDCVMILESSGESVILSLKGDFLQKLQHT
jgi:hypothetical protein